ncbi:Autotransporter-associated beta strand repeat protein [Pirellulimonas nuda]|uniref:Autotransporter-associated beta strand repeat protein n=1 Tax=Pirellulimonas nuda TaxID=2528009 RepID=A0A518DD81_9BACT|nr:autotransporter-associated beta strand repeat-containing protein [Pirellulimonas nuda]QDU89429.1 Autotransporter-associated beta strand repeat protein [Pirellulimonas nuda]
MRHANTARLGVSVRDQTTGPVLGLLLLVLLAAPTPAEPARFWIATSAEAPAGPGSPSVPAPWGAPRLFYLWAQPATVAEGAYDPLQNPFDVLQRFSLNLVAPDPEVIFTQASITVHNPQIGPNARRFEFVNDAGTGLALTTPQRRLAGDAYPLQGAQGYSIFSNDTIDIGPLCDPGDGLCTPSLGGAPAWLIATLSLQLEPGSPDAALFLQIGELGMNHLGAGSAQTMVVFGDGAGPVYRAGPAGASDRGVTLPGDTPDLLLRTTPAPGDYNLDGFVDAADYSVWRDSLTQAGAGLAADGDGSGVIDAGDYDVWRDNFGVPAGATLARPVPEPAAGLLLALAVAYLCVSRRSRHRGAWCGPVVLSALTLLPPAPADAAQIVARWTGPSGGVWSNPGNWDANQTPANGVDTYAVVIPTDLTVNLDVGVPSPVEIDALNLAGNANLSIAAGQKLSVLGGTLLEGTLALNGGGAEFNALGGGVGFGSNARVSVVGGATASLSATGYALVTNPGSATLLSAAGAGSRLGLPSLGSITSIATSGTQTIEAAGGGVLDLSGVTTIQKNNGGTLRFRVAGAGSSLDLSALQSISGSTLMDVSGSGLLTLAGLSETTGMSVAVDGGSTLNLPALAAYRYASMTVAAGGTVNAPGVTDITGAQLSLTPQTSVNLGTLAVIDDARIAVSGGRVFNQVSATGYALVTNPGSATLLSASGAGSRLGLPSLDSITSVATSGTQTIEAAGGGVLDLSGVTTIQKNNGGTLKFRVAGAGSSLDLSALQSISGSTLMDVSGSGLLTLAGLSETTGMSVAVDGGSTLNLPALAAYRYASMTVAAGGTVNAPGVTDITGAQLSLTPQTSVNLGTLAVIDDARIAVSGGRVFNQVSATGYALVTNPGSATLLSASGAGSRLGLPSLDSITSVATSGTQTIEAAGGGVLDLSGVTTIQKNNGGTLRFRVAGAGSSLDLSALQSISGSTLMDVSGSGLLTLAGLSETTGMSVAVDGGSTLNLPALAAYRYASMTVAAGGTVNALGVTDITGAQLSLTPQTSVNLGTLAVIDDARIAVSGGRVFNQVSATGYALVTNPGSATLLSASGAGSRLGLPSLDSITSVATSGTQTIEAAGGGVLDLSGVTTIQKNNGGTLRFQARTGGRLSLGGLVASGSVRIEADGLDSGIEVAGDLVLGASASLLVDNQATLRVGGDVSYPAIEFDYDGGVLNLVGGGAQQLEVGGADLLVGGATAGNFGLGRLLVGSPGQGTGVTLVDAVDNGNRGGAGGQDESLYLYGVGGPNGLVVYPDSVLTLNGLNVYAWDPSAGGGAGAQVHLNSLFAPGQNRIPYFGGGYLQLTADVVNSWLEDGGGAWSSAASWTAGLAPNGPNDEAILSAALVSGPATIVLDLDATVASVRFDNATYGYTIGADGVHRLTLTGAAQLNAVAGTHAISAPIAGTAGLHKTGAGRLTLSGASDYSGPTRISAGVLAVASAGGLGASRSINVAAASTLDLSGLGGYTLPSGGRLDGQGTVVVRKGAQAATLTIPQTGVLGGSLTLLGDVANAGRLAPGASPGIVTVVGDYTQLAGSTLEIEFGGLTPSVEHDLVIVTGAADLNGSLAVPLYNGYTPNFSSGVALEYITALTAAGGVSGRFVDADSPNSSYGVIVIYGSHTVEVALTPGTGFQSLLADMNGNGFLDPGDWAGFAHALRDPDGYDDGFFQPGRHIAVGDLDRNGRLDFDDVGRFATYYAAGGGASYAEVLAGISGRLAVPEPVSAVLLVTVAAPWLAAPTRRRRLRIGAPNRGAVGTGRLR